MNNQDNPYSNAAGQGNYQVSQQTSIADRQASEKPGLDLGIGAPGHQGEPQAEIGKDISTAEFMAEVIEASQSIPVVIDFWAPWCGPCKQLTPTLEKVAGEFAGQVKLVKMNTEQYPEVAGQMKIQSIPAVVAFVDGKPVDAFMGVKPESEIRKFFEKHGGPSKGIDQEKLFAEIRTFIADEDFPSAMGLLQGFMQENAENATALALLGIIMLKNGETEQAENIFASINPNDYQLADVVALKAELELLKQADELGDIEQLIKNTKDNPKDFQAKFDLSLAYNAAGQRELATDYLLEIIKASREWNDDGARKQLLKYFEAWGGADEATQSGRRRLSAALFS